MVLKYLKQGESLEEILLSFISAATSMTSQQKRFQSELSAIMTGNPFLRSYGCFHRPGKKGKPEHGGFILNGHLEGKPDRKIVISLTRRAELPTVCG